jgi:hypothetical protein
MFACGDKYQPGVLFLCNGNNPDAASDILQIEITPPSEPLMNGVMFDGTAFVWSSERFFRLYPSLGQGLVVEGGNLLPAEGTNLFVPLEVPNGKGLFPARWACCVGSKIWFRGRDGIYETTGDEPVPITLNEWSQIFPQEGASVGAPIQAGPVTVYPPDDTQPQFQRLSYYDSTLYFDYKDTQGNLRTLVYDTYFKNWSVDDYTPQVLIHYGEEGYGVHNILCGAVDGNLYSMIGGDDDGVDIGCSASFPLMSEGVGGFNHIRMAYIGLDAAVGDVTIGVTADDLFGSVVVPNPATYERAFLNLPALKGKLLQWYASSTQPFSLIQRDGEFYIRPWGATGAYRKINPFGSLKRAQAQKLD